MKKKYFQLGKSLFLSLLSGLMMTLSFPEFNYHYLAFIALVPLLVVIYTQGTLKTFICIIAFVVSFYYNFLDWIKVFHPLALPGLTFYLCLIYLIPFFLFRWMKRKKEGIYNIVLFSVIFVLFEYMREQGFAKFPYGVIAYSQYQFLSFIQIADIFGHFGISFFIYFTNVAIADKIVSWFWGDQRFSQDGFFRSFVRGGFNRFTFILILFLIIIIYGNARLQSGDESQLVKRAKDKIESFFSFDDEEQKEKDQKQSTTSKADNPPSQEPSKSQRTRISIIQPWFDYNLPWTKENRDLLFNKLVTLTLKAAKDRPDLIVWPESSINDYYEYRLNPNNIHRNSTAKSFYRFFQDFGRQYPKINILAGSLSLSEVNYQTFVEKKAQSAKDAKTGSIGSGVKYNSVLFFDRQGKVIQKSAKKYLVPVAEYFPYREILKHLSWFAAILKQAQASNFTPFDRYEVFNHPKGNFSVLVCYEDTFSDLSRDYVLRGAHYLVVVTNDAWSYTLKSQEIHYAFIFFRAIENRRAFIRAGNAGVSGMIDSRGMTKGILPQFQEGYTTVELETSEDLSFYTQYGYLFIVFLIVLFLGYHLAFIFSKIMLVIISIVSFFRWTKNKLK